MNASVARRTREQAAARFRPEVVRLLLVAEAPPSDLDRYFYFEDVGAHDGLFRYVIKTVLGEKPSRSGKARQLVALRDRGVFLIDLKIDPKIGDERLGAYVEDLVARAVALNPDYVITIKANVCTLCQGPLRDAGLNVSDERVPFPSTGRQGDFEIKMDRALKAISWRP